MWQEEQLVNLIGAEVGTASLVTPYGFNLKWLVLPTLAQSEGAKAGTA